MIEKIKHFFVLTSAIVKKIKPLKILKKFILPSFIVWLSSYNTSFATCRLLASYYNIFTSDEFYYDASYKQKPSPFFSITNRLSGNATCLDGYSIPVTGAGTYLVNCTNGFFGTINYINPPNSYGTFNPNTVQCQKMCLFANIPANLRAYYQTATDAPRSSTRTINCANDYGIKQTNGSFNTSYNLSCNSSSAWDSTQFKTCEQIGCYVSDPSYNKIINLSTFQGGSASSTTSVSCATGYSLQDGTNNPFTVQCGYANGDWVANSNKTTVLSGLQTCYKGCSITNDKYNPQTISVKHGETKSISCVAGYYSQVTKASSFNVTCNSGVLTGAQSCVGSCLLSGDGYNPTSYAIPDGESITANCKPNYKTDAGATSMNVSCSGSALSGNAICRAPCNFSNDLVKNGPLTMFHLESQQIQCIDGYTLTQTTNTQTITCRDGVISGFSKCNAKCSIGDFKSIFGDSKYKIMQNSSEVSSSYVIEGDSLLVQCMDDSGNIYDSYSTSCTSSGNFSVTRSCGRSTVQCIGLSGTIGEKLNIVATNTPSKNITEGENYTINCNNGYFSSILGSNDTSFSLGCKNGVIQNKQTCVKKCSPSQLGYLGDVSFTALFTRSTPLTTSDTVEAGRSLSVTCNPKDGYSYASINPKSQVAFPTVNYSCNTSGYFKAQSHLTTCMRVDCANSEILFVEEFGVGIQPEFKNGITPNQTQLQCPTGFISNVEENGRFPICKNGLWVGADSIRCSLMKPINKPSNASSTERLNCKVSKTAFPNATLNAAFNEDFATIGDGKQAVVNCNTNIDPTTGSKYLVDIDVSSINGTTKFNIACNGGKISHIVNDIQSPFQNTCIAKCDANNIKKPNAEITQSGSVLFRRYFNPGEVLTVNCLDGYGLSGVKTFTTTCKENGEFSNRSKCVANYKDCNNSDLALYSNIDRIDRSSIIDGTTKVGDRYTPKCLPGYNSPTSAICVNGQWAVSNSNNPTLSGGSVGGNSSIASSSNRLTCMQNCDYNDLPQLYITKTDPTNNIFNYGDVVKRSCSPNTPSQKYSNLRNFSTCLDGEWSNDLLCYKYFKISPYTFNPEGKFDQIIWDNIFSDYYNKTVDNDSIVGPGTYNFNCGNGSRAFLQLRQSVDIGPFSDKPQFYHFVPTESFSVDNYGNISFNYRQGDPLISQTLSHAASLSMTPRQIADHFGFKYVPKTSLPFNDCSTIFYICKDNVYYNDGIVCCKTKYVVIDSDNNKGAICEDQSTF